MSGTEKDNISTRHQKKGDARKPSDTLDRPGETRARDWQPGADEGKSDPGGADR